ncbi:hypothetical protein GCK72_007520 [Caenorhabditis remanei]|uniref:Uncharacterized protein n=1 Tax=Caenorhabditis remanei TaxID=31234 RepID=A0A6A5HKB2_CAERE|nr:hypothetical protein GCK72_007520 [Caenorhabditis remanei]KAF1767561.1 hypothetical protein GCK72_007520 [Caenorhabditis remanei]
MASKDDVLYTEEAGCVNNITCRVTFATFLTFKLDDTEIPIPEDNGRNIGRLHAGEEEGSPVDLFSSFGIICENNEWYITKYPSGIEYFSKNCKCYHFIGVGGEYDGKKSKLDEFNCVRLMREIHKISMDFQNSVEIGSGDRIVRNSQIVEEICPASAIDLENYIVSEGKVMEARRSLLEQARSRSKKSIAARICISSVMF